MDLRDRSIHLRRARAAVHALKNLLLKNTGFEGIYLDVGILSAFAIVLISGCIALFKRQI